VRKLPGAAVASVLSVAIAAIALFISLQSNQIAREANRLSQEANEISVRQGSVQVVMVGAEAVPYTLKDWPANAAYTVTVQIKNLGLAPAAVVGSEVVVRYDGQESEQDDNGAPDQLITITGGKLNAVIAILQPNEYTQLGPGYSIYRGYSAGRYPVLVGREETISLKYLVIIGLADGAKAEPGGLGKDTVTFSVKLHFPSGQSVVSPRLILCRIPT